jgi:hypothetical protein
VSKSTSKRRVAAKTATTKKKATRKSAIKTKATARKGARPKPRAPSVRRTPPAVVPPSPEEEAAYLDALIEAGQAAPLTEEGKLPAGATHKIVEDEHGRRRAVRRRFSMT